MPRFIIACCLGFSLASVAAEASESCVVCHRVVQRGAHAALNCLACHLRDSGTVGKPAAVENLAVGCVSCHKGRERIFDHSKVTLTGEKRLVQSSCASPDGGSIEKSFSYLHIQGCLDCHGEGHDITKPSVKQCQNCHKGYYTGGDNADRDSREDNISYQRGLAVNGEEFLKMLPDVHYSGGMTCGACHSMNSLANGEKTSKRCRDCHKPDLKIIEHRIPAHLQRMECYACHSSWAQQDYSTFFLFFRDQRLKDDLDLKSGSSTVYPRSPSLKKLDAPPLGINAAGRISPIRPMFSVYNTDDITAKNDGTENSLLTAEWRAYFPHTVQRGTVACEGCHDNPARFLLEPESLRICNPVKDGMGLESLRLQKGQRVSNGSFMDAVSYLRMNSKSPAYTKAYAEKWKTFLDRVVN